MVSNLVSLADASQLLGISVERVRQLVVAGDLPGVRFGNAWAVPRDAVAARRQVSNRRGRPLGQQRVWQAITSEGVDLSNVNRYRNRGAVKRYTMSTADARHLVTDLGAVESGVVGAVFHGQLLQPERSEFDLYVPQRVHDRLGSIVAAVEDQLGSVILRIVSDEVWVDVEASASKSNDGSLVAPAAAVALDLMESGDARHWVAAEKLVQAHD